MRGNRWKFVIAGVLALSLVGAACSNDDDGWWWNDRWRDEPVPAASAPRRTR